MARRRSPWHVERNPADLRFAFFISHVGEDADPVKELKAEITSHSGHGGRSELSCFLDLSNWEIANDPGRVIRDNLARSEYMVAWITPAYLEASRRGWIWFEFAYAELIELSLNAVHFGREQPFIVPVPVGVSITDVERTPLANFWLRRLSGDGTIPGIARSLVDLYYQEATKRGRGPVPPKSAP